MEDLREQQELKRLYTHFEQVMMCMYLCVCVRFSFHNVC